MYTDFNHFFTVTPRNVWRIHTKSRLPPHLYSVAAIPSKTRSTVGMDRCNVIRCHNGPLPLPDFKQLVDLLSFSKQTLNT